MDFSRFDKVQERLNALFEYINSLKDQNRQLKRKVYSLELNLEQARAASQGRDMKKKYSLLVEERDRLIMEREFIRNKVQGVINKLDDIQKSGSGD